MTKDFKRTPQNVCKKLLLPTAHTVRLKPNHPRILPTHGTWLCPGRFALGSGHEQEEDVTATVPAGRCLQSHTHWQNPRSFPNRQAQGVPKQQLKAEKTDGKHWPFVWEPLAQYSDRARGRCAVSRWSHCQAGQSGSLQLQLHPTCSEIPDQNHCVLSWSHWRESRHSPRCCRCVWHSLNCHSTGLVWF